MRTFILFLFAAIASAQTTATTITDTIRIPVSNALFTGTITIIPSHGMTCGANSYVPQPTTVTITSGVLSTALVPNASCSPVDGDGNPASYYTVRYAGRNFAQTEVWVVPVSGTAVTVSAVRSTAPLSAVATISPSQILPGGATTGQGLIFNGSNYAPGTITATPSAHASSHAAAGSDPLTVAQSQVTNLTTDLGNKVGTSDSRLTDARTPTSHAASHGSAGGDAIAVAQSQVTNLSTDLGNKVDTSDSRLTDARTPTAHATAHQNGGADEIATATAAANAIPKAGADGKLASGWFPSGVGMVYPGDGVAAASGGAWGTSLAIGTDLQAYDADLAAVAGLSTAGLVARTGTGTAASRTIQAGTLVSVTNGDGVSGDPSVDADDTIITTFSSGTADPVGACTLGQVYHRTDTDETWNCANTTWTQAAKEGGAIAASQVSSGTLDAARIPSLPASQITSGTFDAARIPTLAGSKIDSADKVGSGTKFPMATALGTSGNCAQWGADGLTDAGAPCGTGGGGGTTGLYSGTIDFGSIADGACASSTFTATGLTTGKTLALSLPSGIDAGLIGTALASAADTAQVRLCNFSGAAVDPASATFKVREMDALGYLTGSAAADLGSIPDGGSVTTTITVTGAATGDNVAPGWPSALNTGLSGVMYVSAANTVTVRVFNWSGAAVDPAELTYAAAITK